MSTVVHEICPTEGPGEYVGVLLGQNYVLHRNVSSPEKVANEVVTLFASGRAQRVFDQCFRPLIVLKDLYASSTRLRRNDDKTARTNTASLTPSPVAMYSASEVDR